MNEARRDALARARRQNPGLGNGRPKPDQTVPRAPELHEEELEYMLIPEENASQIGACNLEEGDVVLYLRSVVFKPDVLKTIAGRGPTALRDYALQQPAYFLITRKEFIADILKVLIDDQVNPEGS